MPKSAERLPPSPTRVFVISAVTLAAYGAYRLFLDKLLPDTAAFNEVPRDLAVAAGSLACAFFLYWLGRLRYGGPVLRNLPGRPAASAAVLIGLAVAAACLQWHRPSADWGWDSLPLRAAGLAAAAAAAACEEIGFRGAFSLSLGEGKTARGDLPALVLGSLGYALIHSAYQTPWSLPFAATAGLALGLARLRGASLASLVVAHAALDGVAALWMGTSLTIGNNLALAAAIVGMATSLVVFILPPVARTAAPAA
jgi:membrane protease YdiL (CAAX protease family)